MKAFEKLLAQHRNHLKRVNQYYRENVERIRQLKRNKYRLKAGISFDAPLSRKGRPRDV